MGKKMMSTWWLNANDWREGGGEEEKRGRMKEEERPALSTSTLGVLRSPGAGWGAGEEEGRGKRGEGRGGEERGRKREKREGEGRKRRGKLGRQGDSGVIEVSSERTDYGENQSKMSVSSDAFETGAGRKLRTWILASIFPVQ